MSESLSLSEEPPARTPGFSTFIPSTRVIDLIDDDDDQQRVEKPPLQQQTLFAAFKKQDAAAAVSSPPVAKKARSEESSSELDLGQLFVPLSKQNNSAKLVMNAAPASSAAPAAAAKKKKEPAASRKRASWKKGTKGAPTRAKKPKAAEKQAAAAASMAEVEPARTAFEFFKLVRSGDFLGSQGDDVIEVVWRTLGDEEKTVFRLLEEVDSKRETAEIRLRDATKK